MIERDGKTILLLGHCPVEDADTLLSFVHDGADVIDWTGCTLLHTACLQVLLAARLPVAGPPQNPSLALFLAPYFVPYTATEI